MSHLAHALLSGERFAVNGVNNFRAPEPAEMDLVLLDGGVNDVNIRTMERETCYYASVGHPNVLGADHIGCGIMDAL